MIKDFSKEDYNEFISMFSISDTWQLIKRLFVEVDQKFVENGERVAFIALKLIDKQGVNLNSKRQFTLAALFNNIGSLWSGNHNSSLMTVDASNAYDVALSSYLFLKYFSPLKDYSDIVLFKNGRADREQINPYFKLGVKLHLCIETDKLINVGMKNSEIIAELEKKSGSVFYPEDVKSMVSLLSKSDFIAKVKSNDFTKDIDDFLSSLYFKREVVRSYLFMVTYCFEFYNTETLFHTIMTAFLSYIFGRYLELDIHQVCQVFTAGLLGDIGKVRIPNEILEKPGKLTPEETSIMRKHIEYTKEILSGCIKEEEVVNIAYSHHERLDGSGYPRGLKGDQLDLKTRIVSVSDILAALLAKRSYKDSYPIDLAIEEMNKMVKENKIDGKLVEIFVNNKMEIYSYLQNHINRMLRNLESLKAEKQRLQYANMWEK